MMMIMIIIIIIIIIIYYYDDEFVWSRWLVWAGVLFWLRIDEFVLC